MSFVYFHCELCILCEMYLVIVRRHHSGKVLKSAEWICIKIEANIYLTSICPTNLWKWMHNLFVESE